MNKIDWEKYVERLLKHYFFVSNKFSDRFLDVPHKFTLEIKKKNEINLCPFSADYRSININNLWLAETIRPYVALGILTHVSNE